MTRSAKTGLLLLSWLLAAVAPSVMAQSTADTVESDTTDCRQDLDHKACERAYDYWVIEMEAAEEEQASGSRRARDPEDFHEELISLADTGCLAGNSWLCTELGWAYQQSTLGLPEDEANSLKYYSHACEFGDGYGCARQGVANELGLSIPVNNEEAKRLYRQGCEMGSTHSCRFEADRELSVHLDAAPPLTEPIAVLQDKCRNRGLHGPTCLALGIAYYQGDVVPADEDRSDQYWREGCNRAVYGQACYLWALKLLSITDMEEERIGGLARGMRALVDACDRGVLAACDFSVFAGQSFAWDNAWVVLKGRFGRCIYQPTQEDCEFAGDAYKIATVQGSDGPREIENGPGRAALAWLTACRNFNTRCVEVANMHLEDWRFNYALAAPNLAIGILETACDKGDAAACARKDEVIAQTGGVKGSYIDPMASDDERFLMARFDLQSGDTQRGRETLQWLAFLDHTDAQLELANAYRGGLDAMPPRDDGSNSTMALFRADVMTWQLYERVARKGVPEAAMLMAVRKYNAPDADYDGVSYEEAIYRALYLGAEGAAELDAADRAADKARIDARIADIEAMNRQNVESRYNMDRQTVQSAWDQYAKRQQEREELEGGRVCGTVYGQGNSTYRTCMTRSTALRYYRGNF